VMGKERGGLACRPTRACSRQAGRTPGHVHDHSDDGDSEALPEARQVAFLFIPESYPSAPCIVLEVHFAEVQGIPLGKVLNAHIGREALPGTR
jgi:hypothetical protein